jgi:FlaA1/EpsC-like NDP-sugar epimerase
MPATRFDEMGLSQERASSAPRTNWLQSPTFNATRALADLLAVLAAFWVSYHVYAWLIAGGVLDRGSPSIPIYMAIGLLFGLVLITTFWHLGLYRQRASALNLWEVTTAIKGLAVAAAFFFALLFFLKLGEHSRVVVVGGK